MLKLPLSLIISAICALFLLGAVLDLLANNDNPEAPNHLSLYITLLETISLQANQQIPTALPAYIEQQQQHWQLPLQLLKRESMALPAELDQQLSATGSLQLAGDEGTSYLKALPEHPSWLLQMQIKPEHTQQPEDLWLTLALYAGLCLIMLLWLAPLTRRLWLLSQTANSFGAGNLHARLPKSRWSYISALEQSFNQMAHQIEQLLAENRLLSCSLSHDLRTPIACFRFGLEAAIDEMNQQRKNQYLQRLELDLDRMEAMINAFLEYASLDRQHYDWQHSQVDVWQLCQHAIQSCEPLATARKLQVHLKLPLHALPLVEGHPHWLYRVLLNLMQNACRYAHQQIQLELWQQDQKLCLRIRDDGIGISKADSNRIFLPFVRLETQSSVAPQFGLGLAIVRKVLEWHQAQITLESTAPFGASFLIQIPFVRLKKG